MNERIMKLAIQAREYAESKPDIYAVAYDKKFAELIVRECVGIARQHNNSGEGGVIAQTIELHFGVE